MFHKNRTWHVVAVDSELELAKDLNQRTWTLCTGFQVAGHPSYYFLNDSLSEDGAQEFAIVKEIEPEKFVQIESITFGWCSFEESLDFVRMTLSGEYDESEYNSEVYPSIERGKHRCGACA